MVRERAGEPTPEEGPLDCKLSDGSVVSVTGPAAAEQASVPEALLKLAKMTSRVAVA